MRRDGKNKFYKKLNIDEDTKELIKEYNKIKKIIIGKEYDRKDNR